MNSYYLLLFLILPVFNGEFTSLPESCTIDDSVILKCRLRAPNGTQFKSIVPQLFTNENSNPITFDRIHEELELRYNGFHIPDDTRTNLKADLTILFLKESDFQILFTCSQQLDNGTSIESTLMLLNRTTNRSLCECPLNTNTIPFDTSNQSVCPPCLNTTRQVNNCSNLRALITTCGVCIFLIIGLFIGVPIVYLVYRLKINRSSIKSYNVPNTPDTDPVPIHGNVGPNWPRPIKLSSNKGKKGKGKGHMRERLIPLSSGTINL